MTATAAAIRPRRLGLDLHAIDTRWEVAPVEPDETGHHALDDLEWIPASVPGTVAGAHHDAGLPIPDDLDGRDWWFRTRFDSLPAASGEEVVLRLGGIATIASIHLDGEPIGSSESMFEAHSIDVTDRVGGSHELVIRCLALGPRLAEPRKPRARWRTALVADGNLRWFRTSLLGRAPGFSPGPPAVGPWRPVTLERRSGLVVEDLRLRTNFVGNEGRLSVTAGLRSLDGSVPDGVRVELDGPSGLHGTELELTRSDAGSTARGEIRIQDVARWWPHTHGTPALHDVRLLVDRAGATLTVEAHRVGFRTLTAGPDADHDIERDGLDLHVNDTRVFARGAVWTPVDPVGLAVSHSDLRASLDLVRAAGMNMLRIAGTGLYETADFHALCDELGILVWQDLMFANMDYPFVDDSFRGAAEREVAALLDRLAQRPSTAVICGNSEVEQQVAMLGLDPSLGQEPFYRDGLLAQARAAEADAVVIPSAPFGGDLPFRPDRGVANYYGVGGYGRPLSDARLAGVRFAAECLAFSNVPDEPGIALDDPAWKSGVPRDRGADWDFEDVRDHYLPLLYAVDPTALRRNEPERYLALSRAVTGEVMAEVFGEWRRAGSPTAGGLVLWWRDVLPGAGWGLVDRGGTPKAAYHHLRRALAPRAVWTTDEGLGGVAVHVANDTPEPLVARLRIGLYRDMELPVGAGEELLEVAAQRTISRDLEAVIGQFVDASWAYRFGPPAQDLIVVTLEAVGGDPTLPIGQAFRFPVGRPLAVAPAEALGLTAEIVAADRDRTILEIASRRLAHGVRIHAEGHIPDDDAFSIEPGHARRVTLRPASPQSSFGGAVLTAVNLAGSLPVDPS
jgi:beta-mannosidase